MKRITTTPRPEWQKTVETQGFGYHTLGGLKYWTEDAYYAITSAQQVGLERATSDLWNMCLDAVQYVIDNKLYYKFAIPEKFHHMIERTWNEDHPAIYGRFDFCVKDGQVKMLEFNADTPTSLFEAGVIQWYWLEDKFQKEDQFNSIHDHLIWYWKELKPYLHKGPLHFTCVKKSLEDLSNVEYMRDCAIQAGLDTKLVFIDDIGWDGENFIDMEGEVIRNIFKLYPWEWMMREDFAENILHAGDNIFWIEPAWKSILSNKAILPILWKLFPGHPLLLPAYFENEKPSSMTSYAKKPILSREGQNVMLIKDGQTIQEIPGEYGEEGFICQELFELPDFDGNHPVVGSWVVGQQACGIGFREDDKLISGNKSRFVPHIIEDAVRDQPHVGSHLMGVNSAELVQGDPNVKTEAYKHDIQPLS
jgi:glutathionylspermidine synthase